MKRELLAILGVTSWMILTVAMLTLGAPTCSAQAPKQTEPDDHGNIATNSDKGQARQDRLAELNDVRILFGEMDEQVRIAAAKLDGDALKRKRRLGSLRSLLAATDQKIILLSAKIHSMEERQRQMEQDLAAAAKQSPRESVDRTDVKDLLVNSRQPMSVEKQRLENLSRQRSQLQIKIEQLQRDHVRHLLKAAVTRESQTPDGTDVLEQLLVEELGPNNMKEVNPNGQKVAP